MNELTAETKVTAEHTTAQIVAAMISAANLVSDAAYAAEIARYREIVCKLPRNEIGQIPAEVEENFTDAQLAAVDILPLLIAARAFAASNGLNAKNMSELPF